MPESTAIAPRCKNQIIVIVKCYEQEKASFKIEKVGSISLKNKANPMTIYQVME